MRKHPIRHTVRRHTREGKPVRSFTRGYGAPRKSPSKTVGAAPQKTYEEMTIGTMYGKYKKILMPFFDQELVTAVSRDETGYDTGGYVESVTTGKRYKWGENWTTGFTLSATRMAKYLDKAGLLPEVEEGPPGGFNAMKRMAKYAVQDWMKDKHGM